LSNVNLPRSYLGFDFGTRRVGVAAGNTLTKNAQALRTISVTGDARFEAIDKLIAQWAPDALVVGVPFHPDGAAHENTVDERYSTTEAIGERARDLDAASAAIILNQFLNTLE
jgi:putative holliday junction resolvase